MKSPLKSFLRCSSVTIIGLVFLFFASSRNQPISALANGNNPTSFDLPTVACWVLSSDSEEDRSRKRSIEQGWGKICQQLEFIDRFTVGITADWEEGYEHISSKSFRAWQAIYNKYVLRSDAPPDFILKTDTDTYILGKNLLRYLRRFDPALPHYVGKQMINQNGVPFVAGTAIILSQAALSKFYEASSEQVDHCMKADFDAFGPAEDLALSTCLKHLGIFPQYTRDEDGRERFMVFNPESLHSDQELPGWYKTFSFNTFVGPGCCSDEAIAFHYTSVDQLSDKEPLFSHGEWTWKQKVKV